MREKEGEERGIERREGEKALASWPKSKSEKCLEHSWHAASISMACGRAARGGACSRA